MKELQVHYLEVVIFLKVCLLVNILAAPFRLTSAIHSIVLHHAYTYYLVPVAHGDSPLSPPLLTVWPVPWLWSHSPPHYLE